MTYIPGPPDANLKLQDSVTKTASFNSGWLDMGRGFAPGGVGMPMVGAVAVEAIDTTDTDEAYSFKLQEADADAAGVVDAGTARDIGAAASASQVGAVLAKGFVTARFVRLVMTAAGTTPSITYSAYLSPV